MLRFFVAEFCIICAAARSGTTFLGEAVARAYGVAWPQEIFHETHAPPGTDFRKAYDSSQRANFFSFRAEAIRERPELIYPDVHSRRVLWDLYLDYLRSTFAEERFLIDVKYTSWHHLDGFWRSPKDAPGLLELVREKGIAVVHLLRRNLFALYCSQRLAERDGIWWKKHREGLVRAGGVAVEGGAYDEITEKPTGGAKRTLRVDLTDCSNWMAKTASEQQQFTEWLGRPLHTLVYEELMDGEGFSSRVNDVFTDVFGRRPMHELKTSHLKIVPPLQQVIKNAQAVLDHFEGTEFEGFVKTSLSGNAGS